MDKKLNRVILFQKQNHAIAEKPATPPAQKSIPQKETVEENEFENIVAWHKSHPYFKWSAMCREVGIDKGNFKRILMAGKPMLSKAVVEKIISIIKKYGYAK